MSWSSGAVFGAVLFPQTSAMFRNFRHCNRFFYELLTLLERERALTIGLIISASLCGATEIRTRDTLLAYTRFPDSENRPTASDYQLVNFAQMGGAVLERFTLKP